MRIKFPTVSVAALVLATSAATAQAPKTDASAALSRAQAREHYKQGLEKLRSESFAEAEKEFQTAVSLDALFVLAHYELGETRMTLKKYPEAVQALEGCIDAHKQVVALQQSDRAAGAKRLDEEMQELRDSIRFFQSGSGRTAVLQPGNQILRLEARLHDLELQKQRGTAPTETPAEFSLALGSAYLRSGKMEQAEKSYAEAIKVNPKMGEAHNNLGFVYFATGRLDEAEKELKAAEKAGFAVNPRFKDDLKKKQQEAAAAKR